MFSYALTPFSILSAQASYHAHLAACALVSCAFLPFVPLCLRVPARGPYGLVATSQLCKTNPISENQELPQPLILQRVPQIFRSTPPEKTNPIKPNSNPKLEPCSTLSEVEGPIKLADAPVAGQFIAAKPASGGAKPDSPAIRQAQYEIRFTRYASRLPLGGDALHAMRPTWRRAVIRCIMRCIMICRKRCQSALIPMGPWVRVKKQNRSV